MQSALIFATGSLPWHERDTTRAPTAAHAAPPATPGGWTDSHWWHHWWGSASEVIADHSFSSFIIAVVIAFMCSCCCIYVVRHTHAVAEARVATTSGVDYTVRRKVWLGPSCRNMLCCCREKQENDPVAEKIGEVVLQISKGISLGLDPIIPRSPPTTCTPSAYTEADRQYVALASSPERATTG